MNKGDQVSYLYMDNSTTEIVDNISIDNESKNAIIFLPSLNCTLSTNLSRLNKKLTFTEIPKRCNLLIPSLIFKCKTPHDAPFNKPLKDYISMDNFNIRNLNSYRTNRFTDLNINVDTFHINMKSISECEFTMDSNLFLYNTICELYKEIDGLHETNHVLASNQTKIINDNELLKKDIELLQRDIELLKRDIELLQRDIELLQHDIDLL